MPNQGLPLPFLYFNLMYIEEIRGDYIKRLLERRRDVMKYLDPGYLVYGEPLDVTGKSVPQDKRSIA